MQYGDEGNVWLGIPEFNLLEQNITLPGISMKFPDVHCTSDGSVCQLVAGEGEINAAISTFSLVSSPLFNLTHTYFLLAGDGGISPKVATIGSVAFAQYAVQVALQYEIDAREKPPEFASGYIPQGSTLPNSYPRYIYGTEVFQLNDALREHALSLARTATLADSPAAASYRIQYANVPELRLHLASRRSSHATPQHRTTGGAARSSGTPSPTTHHCSRTAQLHIARRSRRTAPSSRRSCAGTSCGASTSRA